MNLKERHAINLILESSQKPWMGVFLRILALFYLLGATVHYGNLLGFGEMKWAESPLSWKLGDICYAILDTAVVIGLWLKTSWGISRFFAGAISQLVLYLGFPHLFAFTEEQRQALWSMVIFHLVSLSIFLGLIFTKK